MNYNYYSIMTSDGKIYHKRTPIIEIDINKNSKTKYFTFAICPVSKFELEYYPLRISINETSTKVNITNSDSIDKKFTAIQKDFEIHIMKILIPYPMITRFYNWLKPTKINIKITGDTRGKFGEYIIITINKILTDHGFIIPKEDEKLIDLSMYWK